jgi:hypothetical protein
VFEPGYWTHKDFTDTFIEVLAIESVTLEYVELTIKWWNVGQTGTPWPLHIFETKRIKTSDFDKWSKYNFNL